MRPSLHLAIPLWALACSSSDRSATLTVDGGATDGPMDGVADGGSAEADAAPPPDGAPAGTRRILLENQREGSTAWVIDTPASNGEVEGYASAVSVAAGEPIQLQVSARPAGAFDYAVFRMGYYGGAGARLVASAAGLAGEAQAAPAFDATTGLVEARWRPTVTLETRDADRTPWLTGVYLVKLTSGGLGSYIVFIVRDDGRDAEVAVQLPTATWQAYNDWGGESLYRSTHGLSGGKARKVSYDRPYAAGSGSATFLSQEYPAVRWMEQRGVDVEYVANLDVAGRLGRVGEHRLFVSIGHDEYATLEAFERLGAAARRGTHLAFLTGNTMYWQIRYEAGSGGDERVVVCYKDRPEEDPRFGVDDAHVTTKFRNPPVSRPENALLGVLSSGRAVRLSVPWVVTRADHWLYEGTGLRDGDEIPELVGFEWDGLADNGHTPAGVVVLAHSIVRAPQGTAPHDATIYSLGDAFVFAASTVDWGLRLAVDERVARMTENVLARAGVALP